jgi:hypothetical protein
MKRMVFCIASVILLGTFYVSSSTPAAEIPSKPTLAPPLRTASSERIGEDEASEEISGQTPHSNFRYEWAFGEISYLIADMLRVVEKIDIERKPPLNSAKDNLIKLLKKHIDKRDGWNQIYLEEFDIDGIEEVREGRVLAGFSLPVKRNGVLAYKIVYNLRNGNMTIPVDNWRTVYVRVDAVN